LSTVWAEVAAEIAHSAAAALCAMLPWYATRGQGRAITWRRPALRTGVAMRRPGLWHCLENCVPWGHRKSVL